MGSGYFITGTDTNVGKTLVSCALLHAFAAQNKRVIGMKPIAAGCENGQWQDVEQLVAASNIIAPRQQINPYAFIPPLAPHIAASQENIEIDLNIISQAYLALQDIAEIVIVEGVGGLQIPLSQRIDGIDLVQTLGLPVILVVGLRLGCLNHALLTANIMRRTGITLAGWIANCIDPQMLEPETNIQFLEEYLEPPLLGVIPFKNQVNESYCSSLLDIKKLIAI